MAEEQIYLILADNDREKIIWVVVSDNVHRNDELGMVTFFTGRTYSTGRTLTYSNRDEPGSELSPIFHTGETYDVERVIFTGKATRS